jgi:RNA-binding protein
VLVCAIYASNASADNNMNLNKTQIKALRAESHRLKLKPVIIIGQNGLSENVQNEIEIALEHHELIKIRIPALDKPGKKQMIETICTRTSANLITAIGNVAVIYRRTENTDRFSKLLSR